MSKRKRPSLKSCCVQEEVEEKSGDKKFGLRQARAKAFNVYSNQSDGKKKIKDNGITKQNGIWFVTCENKEGVMDIEKLKKGENCIECRGLWFTPPAFEEFAGRGACKKWKNSICHEGRPLTHWFAKGILSTTGYQRRGAEPMKKVKVSSRKMENKPTKSVHKFQGSKRSKYKRSSSSVTQKSIPPGEFTPSAEAEVRPVQSPEGGRSKDGHHQSDSDEFLKRGQRNGDDPDERNDNHSINSGDAEDENKTDNGVVPADADYPDDRGDARESPEDSDAAKAQEQEMKRKNKVIIRRLSERSRACKAKRRPKGSWCEPLEDNAHVEETEGDAAVAEGKNLINENLGASAELVVSSNGDRIDEEKDAVLEMRSPQHAEMTSSPLVKDQTSDPMGLSVAPANLLLPFVNKEINEKDADEAKPDRDEAELERSETCIRVSDCRNVSEKMEDGASDGSDVDAMDVDQLKKEKLKMQLKVLKLQEEYYTLKLNNLK
ncbi:PREDICTED: uncharacterized protein LOC106920467 [Poecilia mexicana]|uniref:uncharacterized protein LOC106920467 n=1 Tax=Poecilia mexicana TaxID=48701 RepID=UPI00072E75DE|nr:PREDICTED: uncharacterized protein LOC106920467 [Poecilia mexicana]